MRIGSRIGAGFAAVLALTAGVGVISWQSLEEFGNRVDTTSSFANIADNVGKAALNLATFRASGDRAELDQAIDDLLEAHETSKTLSPEQAAELDAPIEQFDTALKDFGNLDLDKRQRLQTMQQETKELLRVASEINQKETERFIEMGDQYSQSISTRNQMLNLVLVANEVIGATNRARYAEAKYRLTMFESDGLSAKQMIQKMSVAADKLVKAASGTKVAKPAQKVATSITKYRANFDALLKAHGAYKTIADVEKNLSSASNAINAQAGDVVAQIQKALSADSGNSDQAKLRDLSNTLLIATAQARQGEAQFRLSKSEEDSKFAGNAIKTMFLSTLKMKKLSKGTDFEGPVKAITKQVSLYRKSFGALEKEYKALDGVKEVERQLVRQSSQINAITSSISKLQFKNYGAAEEAAKIAQKQMNIAVKAQISALNVVAQVGDVRLAEFSYIDRDGGERAIRTINYGLGNIRSESAGLKLYASEEDKKALETLLQRVSAYEAAFSGVIAVTDQQKATTDLMSQSRQTVLSTVAASTDAQMQAMADGRNEANLLIAIGALGALLLGTITAWLIGRSITKPLSASTGQMERLAQNDLSVEITGADRKDELSDIAKALQVFKDNAERVQKMEEEKAELERAAEEEKRKTMEELAEGFEASVKSVVTSVAEFAQSMHTNADSMSQESDAATNQATEMAAASEQSAVNVQTVSSAAEQLSASISEIGIQVRSATEIAQAAAQSSQSGNKNGQQLTETVDKIGEVINLIDEISEQTNLLALNATIEAARAGDAGKGFAVVANEVKSLSSQTAQATEEIRAQISDMQSASSGVVESLTDIDQVIEQISEVNNAIAAAIEEQDATTREIARNTQEAARGAQQISESVTQVSAASERTGNSARIVLDVADKLSGTSDSLTKEVDNFLSQVRAS